MKKRMFAVLVAVALFCSSVMVVLAEEGEKEKILTGYFNAGFKTANVCSGTVLHNGPVIQPAIGVIYEPLGIFAEIWASYSPEGGWNSDPGDEVDFTVGGDWALNKYILLSLGYSSWNLVNLNNTTGDLHDFYVNLTSTEIYGLTPSLNLDFIYPQDKDVLDGGVTWEIALKTYQNILGQQIIFTGTGYGHDGAYGGEAELISALNLGIGADISLGENWILSPEINFQKKIGKDLNDGGSTKDYIWGGAKIQYNFDII